jgi:hypothetical protein
MMYSNEVAAAGTRWETVGDCSICAGAAAAVRVLE